MLMQRCPAEHVLPDGTTVRCAELPRAVRGVSWRLRVRMVVAMWREPIIGAGRPRQVGTTASLWCRELRGRDGRASWVWVHAR
jgi:hypothetical protein